MAPTSAAQRATALDQGVMEMIYVPTTVVLSNEGSMQAAGPLKRGITGFRSAVQDVRGLMKAAGQKVAAASTDAGNRLRKKGEMQNHVPDLMLGSDLRQALENEHFDSQQTTGDFGNQEFHENKPDDGPVTPSDSHECTCTARKLIKKKPIPRQHDWAHRARAEIAAQRAAEAAHDTGVEGTDHHAAETIAASERQLQEDNDGAIAALEQEAEDAGLYLAKRYTVPRRHDQRRDAVDRAMDTDNVQLATERKEARLGAEKEEARRAVEEEGRRAAQEARGAANAARRTRLQDCAICGESKPHKNFSSATPTASCAHPSHTCIKCVRSWIASQFETQGVADMKCPVCPEILTYNDIKRCALRKTFAAYDKALTRNALSSDPDFVWCLAPRCGSGQLVTSKRAIFMICSTCSFKQCLRHKIAWHAGETCEQYDYRTSGAQTRTEERKTNAMLDKVSKICPGPDCGWRIQRNAGCAHMTCSKCRFQFCWECLASHKEIDRVGNTAHARSCKFHTANLSWHSYP